MSANGFEALILVFLEGIQGFRNVAPRDLECESLALVAHADARARGGVFEGFHKRNPGVDAEQFQVAFVFSAVCEGGGADGFG